MTSHSVTNKHTLPPLIIHSPKQQSVAFAVEDLVQRCFNCDELVQHGSLGGRASDDNCCDKCVKDLCNCFCECCWSCGRIGITIVIESVKILGRRLNPL